tara:strand:- start:5 stop:409 length:405 start_codon:yes stop_codon:yes gene_type:complete
MTYHLNYYANLLNLFLIFVYLILININLEKKEFGFIIIYLIIINLLVKLYSWYNYSITKKYNLNAILDIIFFNKNFIKLVILIFSIVTPIYMIFQKDSLVINLSMEKLSFLLVFIFALLGFYLEFFILERKLNK